MSIKEYIEVNVAHDNLLQASRINKSKPYSGSLAEWWGWDFYELRSRIVHGDMVVSEDLRYCG